MASAGAMPPMLSLKRSSQSGAKAMAAAYAAVYSESSSQSFIFSGANIDLSTMAAADVIDIRIRKVIIQGGGWVNHDEVQYADAQPTGHPSISIAGIANIYGIEISMRQTAGVLRTKPCEFFDAKRLGLA